MNRRLIRFDVRQDRRDYYVDLHWLRAARRAYLLRPEVDWPLSVDTAVWPSLFYSEVVKSHAQAMSGSVEVPISKDDGEYWLDMERMLAHYDSHKNSNTRGIAIAIELLSEASLDDDYQSYELSGGIQCAAVLGRTVPSAPPPGSELFGYDVADPGRLSGLCNCAYTPDEVAQLPKTWASRLNDFGLLTNLDDAVEFRQLTNHRVPEHAPFWIYAIWRLPA
jgi:hypothetical protein